MEYFKDPLNQGRFFRRLGHRISDDDHWIWASTVMKRRRADGEVRGYVQPILAIKLAIGSKNMLARRFAWEMETCRAVDRDMAVVNVCGEQLCVKPEEKHNIPVVIGSWNTRTDKRAYQQRQGIVGVGYEPTITQLPDGGFLISEKLVPDYIDVMSEEEFMALREDVRLGKK